MKTLKELFKSYLTVLTVLLCLPAVSHAQQIGGVDNSFVQELVPTAGVVSIQQVTFIFDAARVVNTDWGQIQIDPVQLGNVTGMDSGYVNLFVYSDSSGQVANWVIRNLYLPKIAVNNCPPTEGGDNSTPPGGPPSSAPPVPSPGGFDPVVVPNMMSMYFDLRPTIEGSGKLSSILGTILVSKQPLPEIGDILSVAARFTPRVVKVQQVVVDAEGYDLEQIRPQADIIEGTSVYPIGPPPLPLPLEPGLDIPGNLLFPIEVFQLAQPNVHCAENQCVPMAHANVLAYLQNRYDGVPLVWNLPHAAVRGIGKVSAAGDVQIWIPVQENSLVANVDAFTRRLEVVDASVGKGSTKCQLIRGAFGYLAAYGELAQAQFRHQGGAELYGDDANCDNGTVLLGEIVSKKEGLFPTWKWMFEQLQLGRGVAILFGRYDMNGNRTSGHMVRVWGAARYNDKDYIYTLDDGKQGINSYGLRTQQWQVADTGQPGWIGIPDGRLNMNGMSWEIEFAISTEAKPTLAIP
ncbi:MAG: hypothetical protein ACYS19_10455 [Planctomycetota bacterium]|jgi:hypothetical protein